MKTWIKKALGFGGVVALAAGLGYSGVANAPAAEAADASQFDAGMLITDSLFYDSDAMTASQVQDFLNKKGKNCTSNCLKDHTLNTTSEPVTSRCDGYTGRKNETAAQVITNVAESCGISPKVLLVMLEKETSLITMKAPQAWRYDRAMGYYCPDNPSRPGWCHPDHAGLFNQIYNASSQLQRYQQNPNSYGYVAGKTNKILYSPKSCGSKSVYIENQATASLYIYTPYTPNSAALNNLYGTGDGCSSYGNRNFWRLYTDWFGSTKANAPEKPATQPSTTPTPTPEPTKAPEPTKTPEPTKAPEPTKTPEPTKAPEPTKTSEPTNAPEPTKTPEPTATSKPSFGAKPDTEKPNDPPTLDKAPDSSGENSANENSSADDSAGDTANDSAMEDAAANEEGAEEGNAGEDAAKAESESDDSDSTAPLTVIPPNDDKSDEGSSSGEGTDASSAEADSLTVVPSNSAEASASEDEVLAQTGAAQLLVMLGVIASLGVLGAAALMARRGRA